MKIKTPCKRLDTLRNIRREAAVIYRAARDEEIDVSDASKLVNILSIIGRMIQGDDLETRLEHLEDAARGGVIHGSNTKSNPGIGTAH